MQLDLNLIPTALQDYIGSSPSQTCDTRNTQVEHHLESSIENQNESVFRNNFQKKNLCWGATELNSQQNEKKTQRQTPEFQFLWELHTKTGRWVLDTCWKWKMKAYQIVCLKNSVNNRASFQETKQRG